MADSRHEKKNPLRRRLVNFGCWMSLALCLASVTGWVWSYISHEEEAWSSDSRESGWWMQVSLFDGRLGVAHVWGAQGRLTGYVDLPAYSSALWNRLWPAYSRAREPASAWERHFGFSGAWMEQPEWSYRWLIVPFWFVTLVTVVLPIWRGRRLWRELLARRRVAAGLCGACGYDLRGSGASERCPECGSATAAGAV